MTFQKFDEMAGVDYNDFLFSDKLDYPMDDRLITYFKNDDIIKDCDANTWMIAFIGQYYKMSEKDVFLLTLANLIGDLLVTGWIIWTKLKEFQYSMDKFDEWFKENVQYMKFKGRHRHYTPLIMKQGLEKWSEIEKCGGVEGYFKTHNYNFTSIANSLEQIKYIGRYLSVIFVQTLNELSHKKVVLDDFFHHADTPFARAFIYLFKLINLPDNVKISDNRFSWIKNKQKMNAILTNIGKELNTDSFLVESRMCDWYYFHQHNPTPYMGSHIFEIQDFIDKTSISKNFDFQWYDEYLNHYNISHTYKKQRFVGENLKILSVDDKISLLQC